MAKKIYDIKPPKVARELENAIKAMAPVAKKRTRKVAQKPKTHSEMVHHQVRRAFPVKEIIAGGVVIVGLLIVYGFFKLPSAHVSVWPKTQVLEFTQTLSAETRVTTPTLAEKSIPARFVEEKKSASQEFSATGSASNDGKAAGTIKVYNKVSPSEPLVLKAGTHFLSDSGKYFITLDKITVPAMSGKNAGSISVKVQAEQAGDEYNIAASKFSVPKLSGTAYYYGIWAESGTAMTGGYVGNVKKVTAEDLKKAKDSMSENLLSQVKMALASKLSADEIMLDEAIVNSVVSSSADKKVDAVAEKFTQTTEVKASVLVFKKADLEKILKEEVIAKLPEGKEFLASSLQVNYKGLSTNMQSGVQMISAKVTAQTYSYIEPAKSASLLTSKSQDQIKEALSAKFGDDISKVQVDFWPFWVKKSPSDTGRITVDVEFK